MKARHLEMMYSSENYWLLHILFPMTLKVSFTYCQVKEDNGIVEKLPNK